MFLVRSVRIVLLLLGVVLFTACSGSGEDVSSGDDYEYEYGQEVYDDEYLATDNETDFDPSAQGWVPATMTVRIDLSQGAILEERDVTTGKATTLQWDLSVTGSQTMTVWVEEDLSKARLMARDAFELPPYEDFDPDSATSEGAIRFDLTMSSVPGADESGGAVNIDKAVHVEGSIDELFVTRFHPSLYGDGYELSLGMRWQATETGHQTMSKKNGLDSQTYNINEQYTETTEFNLYPTPANQLQDYPFIDAEPGSELFDLARTNELSFLTSLQNELNAPRHVTSGIRVGAVTTYNEDSVQVRFHYGAENQIPLEGFSSNSELVLTPEPQTNSLTITVDIVKD